MADLLPLQLQYGLIAVYHISDRRSSINSIRAPQDFNWATIYQISPYGIPYYRTVGQSALFNGKDIICTLAVDGVRYSILEEVRLVTIEL